MLEIKGIEKLLSVNPHLLHIEEYKDRYRLHIKDESINLPLLFDVFRLSRDTDNYKISLHAHHSEEVYVYNSFDMGCSFKTFSDMDTFSEFMNNIHQTWQRGVLTGKKVDVSKIRPFGDRIGMWTGM
jgi:hypothetical protein